MFGQVVTGSSIYNNDSQYSYANLWDGNDTTSWHSQSESPHWTILDLGEGKSGDVKAYRILSRNDTHNLTSWKLYGSNNNLDWYVIHSVPNSGTDWSVPRSFLISDNIVVALLHFNGDNGSQSFVDNASIPHTFSIVGNAQLSTAQAKFGASSAFFDGSGDGIRCNNSDYAFGTGDFTIECWVNPINGGHGQANSRILETRAWGTSGGISLVTDNMTNPASIGLLGSYTTDNLSIWSRTTIPNSAWTHLCVTRQSGIFNLWIDGVLHNTNGNTSLNLSAGALSIGCNNIGGESFYGFIDELRIIKGISNYKPTMTPSVPPVRFNTNLPDAYYSNVALMLPFCGTPGSNVFVDVSPTPKTITTFGDTQHSVSQTKWGDSSAYFDGSGDYLRIPYSSDLSLQGNFTVEAWFNASAFTGGPIISKDTYGSNFDFSLQIVDATTIACYSNGTTTNLTVTVPTMSTGTWYHVAFVRNGSTNTIYLNGTAYGSNTMSISNDSQVYLTIGCFGWNQPSGYFRGYIQDLRITQAARYTSNFTPPTTELAQDPNFADVKLLLRFNGTNGSTTFTDSSGTPKTFSRTGTCNISTTQGKWGGTSGYFANGVIVTPGHADFNMGTGDFTIEYWCYPTTVGGSTPKRHFSAEGATQSICIREDASNVMSAFFRAGVTSVTTLLGAVNFTANTWQHVALVRKSGFVTLYKNGLGIGAHYVPGAIDLTSVSVAIGATSSNAECYQGYIDDLRVTKGVARYSCNFTVPTSPFSDPATIEPHYNVSGSCLFIHPGYPPVNPQITINNRQEKADWDLIDGGTYTLSGTITMEGSPVSRKVYLFDHKSKRLISTTWSRESDGYYEFKKLKKTTTYWVVSEDYQHIFHTVCSDEVTVNL